MEEKAFCPQCERLFLAAFIDIGMCRHKIPVVKGNVTDNTETVSNNAKLKDIAEMSVDIKMFEKMPYLCGL